MPLRDYTYVHIFVCIHVSITGYDIKTESVRRIHVQGFEDFEEYEINLLAIIVLRSILIQGSTTCQSPSGTTDS